MKLRFLQILLLAVALNFFFIAHAQVPDVDSFQKSILESVQKDLKQKGVTKYYSDSLPDLSGKSPVDLGSLFKELNKNMRVARSAGDIYKLTGGYRKLSTIDSIRVTIKELTKILNFTPCTATVCKKKKQSKKNSRRKCNMSLIKNRRSQKQSRKKKMPSKKE